MIDNISVSAPAAPVPVAPALPDGSATAPSLSVQPGYCGVPRCRKYLSDASAPCPACAQVQRVADEAAQRLEAKRLHEAARQERLALCAPKHAVRFWQGLSAGLIVLSLFLSLCLVVRDPAPAHRQARMLTQELASSRNRYNAFLRAAAAPKPSRVVVRGAGTAAFNGTYTDAGSYGGTRYYLKDAGHVLSYEIGSIGGQWYLGFSPGATSHVYMGPFPGDPTNPANPSSGWGGTYNNSLPYPTVTAPGFTRVPG